MRKPLLLFLLAAVLGAATQPENFIIEIIRHTERNVGDPSGRLVIGDMAVNGANIGPTYENAAAMIPSGEYRGVMRYESVKGFAQGACGLVGNEGDFLLEVDNVRAANGDKRSNILFHAGSAPHHSQGCILTGSRKRDAQGKLLPLEDTHPLRKLRLLFYGTDQPIASPNKIIIIKITDSRPTN